MVKKPKAVPRETVAVDTETLNRDPFTVHVTMKVESRFEDRLDKTTKEYLDELDQAVSNAEALPGKGDVDFARKIDAFRSTVHGLKRELLERVDGVKQCSIILGKVDI